MFDKPTVLSTPFRTSFLLGALHRRNKCANFCHDLCKIICRNYLYTTSIILVNGFQKKQNKKKKKQTKKKNKKKTHTNIFNFPNSKNECKLYKKICRVGNLGADFQ